VPVIEAVNRLMDCRGHVTGAAVRVQTARGPEPLSVVLEAGADVEQRLAGSPVAFAHRGPAGPQPRIGSGSAS
jgi:hypothetical protein